VVSEGPGPARGWWGSGLPGCDPPRWRGRWRRGRRPRRVPGAPDRVGL